MGSSKPREAIKEAMHAASAEVPPKHTPPSAAELAPRPAPVVEFERRGKKQEGCRGESEEGSRGEGEEGRGCKSKERGGGESQEGGSGESEDPGRRESAERGRREGEGRSGAED